jgi:uncharacterized membrane protein YcaP (DUF421 family)
VESIFRGAAVYLFILIIVRVSGRRTLSEMTVFDLVLILIIAETTQQALLGDDFSVVNAVLLIITLFTMDIGFSYLKRWSPLVDKLIEGTPTLLVNDGKSDHRALSRARVDEKDVLSAARVQMGLERMDQVKYAILEADGKISIIPREENR